MIKDQKAIRSREQTKRSTHAVARNVLQDLAKKHGLTLTDIYPIIEKQARSEGLHEGKIKELAFNFLKSKGIVVKT